MPSKPTTTPITEDAIRTEAYRLWEADGRPFGRDEHYWGLALNELTAPAKATRSLAAAKPAEKKARPAAKPMKAEAARAPKAPGKVKKPKA